MRQLAFLLLVAGCKRSPSTVVEADTDTDADTDSDTDADTDSDTDADTDTDTTPQDADGDGSPADEDCDDNDPHSFPGAAEHCDGRDNDCDGHTPYEVDADSDGALDCQPCEDEGWFSSTAGRSGSSLRAVLRDLMEAHSCDDYSDARTFMFNTLDVRPDGQVECVYTGITDTPDGGTTAGVLNTEHSWPQSQGADVHPARCDLHHLYPTENTANSRRSNHPFGVVTTASWEGGGSRYGTDAVDHTVFEPRDAHKGNVARSLIYFSTQYEIPLDPTYLALLQDWSALDPVDATELERTLAIADEQGAANAFVVCPHLVDVY